MYTDPAAATAQNSVKADVAYDIFLGGSSCIGPGENHPYEK